MTDKTKIGLFFGAGAEQSYGLPSGGEFALQIFAQDTTNVKKAFKEMRANIDEGSSYAADWLPDGYTNKPVSCFGRSQYEALIASTLENQKQAVIKFLNEFDKHFSSICKASFGVTDFNKIMRELSGKDVDDTNYSQKIKLTKALSEDVKLFESNYFSSILEILVSKKGEEKEWYDELRQLVMAFLELLVGAVGVRLVNQLNDSLFEKTDNIDLFDDLSGFFRVDYGKITGLGLILNAKKRTKTEDNTSKLVKVTHLTLRKLFTETLDYQGLVDNYYRYLFCPSTDWGKFCKIFTFLMLARDYIASNKDSFDEIINNGDGYYHDLTKAPAAGTIYAIGTSNYNNFIKNIAPKPPAVHLNGSVDDLYDPYKNKLYSADELETERRFLAPLLFTQSGIKPLTSVDMSKRYVELYDNYKGCDVIGIVGFSFSSDDGHINGLFRSLCEDEKKTVVIFHYPSPQDRDEDIMKMYKRKLRITDASTLFIKVFDEDGSRNCYGKPWLDTLMDVTLK